MRVECNLEKEGVTRKIYKRPSPPDLGVNHRDADPVVVEKHTALPPVFIQLLTDDTEVSKVKYFGKQT